MVIRHHAVKIFFQLLERVAVFTRHRPSLNDDPRYAKRALATGMQYTIGNTAGIVMPWLFKSADGPHFYTGYGVSIAATFVSICIFLFMSWYYRRVNRRRAEGKEDWKLENKTEDEIGELGDWSPRYIYPT
ncbi:uncharacterized protein BDV14DRAFT_199543 [Aspergillus stella-maris]|uniref:uncharacterized protein n=1 Tax=Aspergillus stella-maris TaxID=1810926 RepID=UPI003CCCE191